MKMLKFKDYLKEMVTAGTIGKFLMQAGINSKGLENPLTRQTLNAQLSKTTSHPFITPYIALGAISRVLAYANIILPQYVFLNKEGGEVIFDVNQFGRMDGVNLDGSKVVNEFKEPYYIYFSYDMEEDGYYDVFAAIVNSEELSRLMSVPDDDSESVNEEAEQIDELSKDTLRSYAIKSHRKGDMAARMSNNGTNKDMTHIANKRFKGFQTAIKKLTYEEELVGNQHKIDANKNGKVDSHDFKILRGLKKK